MSLDAKLTRESDFWDAKQNIATEARDPSLHVVSADDRTDRAVPWLSYLGFPAYIEAMLGRIGPVKDKRVLDLGTGSGFVASLLAAQGARVDAVDVSGASLEIAQWRAQISGVADRIAFHKTAVETLPFEDCRFDAICGTFVLHHLDLALAGPEMRRVLKPGGQGAFIETSGQSAVLMAARRLLPGRLGIEKASSDDEAPLGGAALSMLNATFGNSVQTDVPSTVFFKMAGYIPPFHKQPFSAIWSIADSQMQRFGLLRQQSYYCVVAFRRPQG